MKEGLISFGIGDTCKVGYEISIIYKTSCKTNCKED